MKRTWLFGYAACTFSLLAGPALAQQAEQHWQATPNYSANNGPNYQPSNAPAAPAAQSGNPALAADAGRAGYQYQQQQPGAGGQQALPSLEVRQPAGQYNQPGGNNPPAGNNQNVPQYPQQYPQPGGAAGQGPIQGPPDRPMTPQVPFVLSQPEINALENLLTDWEKRNKEIQTMESKFFRWKYDGVFDTPNPNQPPPPPDDGELKFAAPDKGLIKIESKDPKRASEQWLCDGKSVFQWDYPKKVVTEYVMPPDLRGKGIGDGPLPFVFGVEAEKLKKRYFMRIITPPNVGNEVWLKAYPKFQGDAANYKRVEVILQIVGPTHVLFPFAIQVYGPNGKDRTVYQLQEPKINPKIFLQGLNPFGDWTKPSIPWDWKKMTQLPAAPAGRTGMNQGATQR